MPGQPSVKISHYWNPPTAACFWQLTGAIGLTQLLPSLCKEEHKFLTEDTLQNEKAMSFQAI